MARWCRNAESKMSGKKKKPNILASRMSARIRTDTAFHTQLDAALTKTIISFKQTAMISKKYPAS